MQKKILNIIPYEALGLWLYKLNPELFKENVNKDLVEKAIIKTTAILETRIPTLTTKHGSRIDES